MLENPEMRHLVYLLLVANVVYFGWNLFDSRLPSSAREVPALPPGVERLKLLEEQHAGAAQDKAVRDIETLTSAQPPAAGASIICQALGPFYAASNIDSIATSLAGLGLQPARREVESQELEGYWVFLPAMDAAELQRVTAVLKSNNDSEYFVGKGNFVALGTFREYKRAESRLEVVRGMGLEAQLEERFVTRQATWLDIESDGSSAAELKRLAAENSSLQLLDLVCY